MALVTRCTHAGCGTLFRVTVAQLQAHGGQVRCGQCGQVFDAFPTLTTVPDASLRPADSPAAPVSRSPAGGARAPTAAELPMTDATAMGDSGPEGARAARPDPAATAPPPGLASVPPSVVLEDAAEVTLPLGLAGRAAAGLEPSPPPLAPGLGDTAAGPAPAPPAPVPRVADRNPVPADAASGVLPDFAASAPGEASPARMQPTGAEGEPDRADIAVSASPDAAPDTLLTAERAVPPTSRGVSPAPADDAHAGRGRAPLLPRADESGDRSAPSADSVKRLADAADGIARQPALRSGATPADAEATSREGAGRVAGRRGVSVRGLLFSAFILLAGLLAAWALTDRLPEPLADLLPAQPPLAVTLALAAVLVGLLLRLVHRYEATWWLVIVVLSLALSVQAAIAWRAELAASHPGARPLLETLCAVGGCRVGLPRESRDLAIESSDLLALDAARPQLIQLVATIRNRGERRVALPAIELTLTDGQERPLARRVLLPVQYVARGVDLEAGVRAGEEFSVRLTLDTTDLRPVGYRLYLFHP